jgi:hypothetical protein
MAHQTANSSIASDTFSALVGKVNELAADESIINVTVAANSTGEITTGNAVVNGIFSAVSLVATTSLGGGTVTTPANLAISTNVVIGANIFVVVGSNAGLHTGIPDSIFTINGTSNVTGNVYHGGITSFGNTTISKGIFTTDVISNTDLGTNISSFITIWSFANTLYNSGKVFAQIKNGNNVVFNEIALAQANGISEITVYATVAAPSTASLGSFSSQVNGSSGNFELLFQQTITHSSIKLAVQMIN